MDAEEQSPEILTTEARSSAQANRWRLWVGPLFSLLLLALVLRDVDFRQVLSALQRADVGLVALAVASFVVTVAAKAARWRVLFALHSPPAFRRSFSMIWIGSAVNAFGPGRFGDLVRAYLVGEAEAESKVYVLGTIAVEKVAELFFLMLALTLLLTQVVLPAWLESSARATAWLLVVAILCFLWLAWQDERVTRWLRWLNRRFASPRMNWFTRKVRSGLDGLGTLRDLHLLAKLLAWSSVVLMLGASTNFIVFAAMGLPLSVWVALALLVVLQIGVAVPSSPGRIGVFHYLVVITLSFFGVDKDVALSYSIILYLVIYMPLGLIGFYSLWSEQVTWKKLGEAAGFVTRFGRRPA